MEGPELVTPELKHLRHSKIYLTQKECYELFQIARKIPNGTIHEFVLNRDNSLDCFSKGSGKKIHQRNDTYGIRVTES